MQGAQSPMKRRSVLAAGFAAALLPVRSYGAQSGSGRVVVVGGGFAGVSCARALRKVDPALQVSLVEARPVFHAAPLSNLVIAGLRSIERQRLGYDALARDGVRLCASAAEQIDPAAHRVRLADGSRLDYDRLVLAPGVDMRWDALPGYDEAAAQRMPHAWQAGAQTLLLRAQLEAMDDGGLVVISVPAGPFPCPPAPYERASLIAGYLQRYKPRSKLLILDARESFPRQAWFERAWRERYGALLERIPLSGGGAVIAVDPVSLTFETDFDHFRAAVANVIPPQRAGRIAAAAGVADRGGWCPVNSLTFESTLQPHVHVIGDAANTDALPKSALGASLQGRACATAVAALLAGRTVLPVTLGNTCVSLTAPDEGLPLSATYRAQSGEWVAVPDGGAADPTEPPAAARAQAARRALSDFDTLVAEVFG